MKPIIEINQITKQYGNHLALEPINLVINKGDVVGLLGTNGAGKSTLMNIISGYFYMTQGTIKINGIDITEQPEKTRKMIGYLPENPPLYMDMTVEEYLKFVCKLKEIPKKLIKVEIIEKMELVNLTNVKKRMIKNLSKGYKQRVGLAQATLGNPAVLILDEPTVGLDPNEMIEIRKLIRQISKKSTVILSSHILSEIKATCNKVIILNKGKHIVTGEPDHIIKQMNQGNKYHLRVI